MKLTCNFYSYVLQRAVDITVVIPTATCPESLGLADYPASHVIKEKYPVVYLLHGFGNNHAQWTGYTNVEMFAEERRIAIVNLSAENKAYARVGGDDFFKFVEEELQEFVTNMFPISAKPEETYIAGLSMGGYGSFLHGLTHPEKYRAIGGFSAGIDLNPETLVMNLVDPTLPKKETIDAYNLHKLVKTVKKFPLIYMSCGDQDHLYETDKKFAQELRDAGADVTWSETAGMDHEWRFWNQEVERFLDWIPRDDYYAKLGKRKV